MSQSSQSYSPRPTCYCPHRRRRTHRHPPHSCRAHCVVLIALCSSRCAQRVVSYLPTFLCFHVKCGSSIYRCTLDIMNRTGLSHYAWNPLRVCECDKSICCDVPCLDSQCDCGAMTRVVQMPFALTRLRPEGKCPDTAASRRKIHWYIPSGKQMPWRAASACTVPWRTASELSRLRPKRPEHLVRPDAQDAIFFFPDVGYQHQHPYCVSNFLCSDRFFIICRVRKIQIGLAVVL